MDVGQQAGMVGGLGASHRQNGAAQTRGTLSPPPGILQGGGPLANAIQRLHEAITASAQLIAETGVRLEGIGVLRPDYPQPSEGRDREISKVAVEPSQLAQALSSLASLIEANNARLSSVANRIDG